MLAALLPAWLLLMTALTGTAEANRIIANFEEGVFRGAVYATDEGAFHSCGAFSKYGDERFAVGVRMRRDGGWDLFFAKLEWRLAPGDTRLLRLRIDGGPWQSLVGRATGSDGNVLEVRMPADPALLDDFRMGNAMEVEVGAERFRPRLTDTARLVSRLQSCVEEQLSVERKRGDGKVVTAEPRRSASGEAPYPSVPGLRQEARFSAGPWRGAGLIGKDDMFTGCMATARFPDALVDIGLRHDGLWSLSLRVADWRSGEKTMPVRLRFDEAAWQDGRGDVIGGRMLLIALDAPLQNALRKARVVDLVIGSQTYGFNLTDMAQLMGALEDCRKARGVRVAVPARPEEDRKPGAGKKPELSSGTGIVVSSAGHVVTNFHVAGECKTVTVQRSGQPAVKAALVVGDEKNDLALLKAELSPGEGEVAPIGMKPMAAGSSVAVYGFPLSGALSSTGNIVAGNISALAGLGNDINYFQISAPVQPGNSGGPLLDYRGQVVGVIQSRIDDRTVVAATGAVPQTVNFAIKAIVLQNFLEVHSVDYRNGAADGAGLDLPGVAAAAQKFTVLVACAA